jgi:phosphatidylserine/phosphatidylglycerophosphate/cardiolipin synthase-like enzyme
MITRPKEEQARHNQKVIDQLNKYTGGNCKSNWKIHSRMVIVDKHEVLISSSDLDRNGLIDQYNAGIYTSDKETVEAAIKFFENIWNESKDGTQSTEVKRR